MSDGVKIIHFNTQGFQNKINNINDFVKVHKPDVLVVTEHFQKSRFDLERIKGYRIVNSFCREHNEKGGVAIWAKHEIPCRPRKDLDRHRKEKEFELVSVTVGDDLVVTGAYRPPSTSIPAFHDHLKRFIKKINKEPEVRHVLTGDFNIDNCKPNKTRAVLHENDLIFHITVGTHKDGRCLDNFITNFETSNTRVIKSKTSQFSDHHPIEIIVQKEALLIGQKMEPFLYKLFQKVFENKPFKLSEESPEKQMSDKKRKKATSSQSIFDKTSFSSMFTRKTNLKSSKKSTNEKSTQKTQATQTTSFFSKFLKIITPDWLKSLTFSASPTKKPKKKVQFVHKGLSETFTSFFSKIVPYFSFIWNAIMGVTPEEPPRQTYRPHTPNFVKGAKPRSFLD